MFTIFSLHVASSLSQMITLLQNLRNATAFLLGDHPCHKKQTKYQLEYQQKSAVSQSEGTSLKLKPWLDSWTILKGINLTLLHCLSVCFHENIPSFWDVDTHAYTQPLTVSMLTQPFFDIHALKLHKNLWTPAWKKCDRVLLVKTHRQNSDLNDFLSNIVIG